MDAPMHQSKSEHREWFCWSKIVNHFQKPTRWFCVRRPRPKSTSSLFGVEIRWINMLTSPASSSTSAVLPSSSLELPLFCFSLEHEWLAESPLLSVGSTESWCNRSGDICLGCNIWVAIAHILVLLTRSLATPSSQSWSFRAWFVAPVNRAFSVALRWRSSSRRWLHFKLAYFLITCPSSDIGNRKDGMPKACSFSLSSTGVPNSFGTWDVLYFNTVMPSHRLLNLPKWDLIRSRINLSTARETKATADSCKNFPFVPGIHMWVAATLVGSPLHIFPISQVVVRSMPCRGSTIHIKKTRPLICVSSSSIWAMLA